MGSLRNPVGPLPSSIYWRRRAVVAAVVALLVALVVWFVGSGGDGPERGSDGANAGSPAPSITPGPSPSGPAIGTQPGGRDESGGSGGSGGSSGTGGSGTGGSGTGGSGTGGSGPGAGGGGSATGGGPGAGTGAGTGSGTGGQGGAPGSDQQVPADSPLPNCPASALQLTLRSTKVSYAPDEKPEFRLTARNTSATGCKTDLGPATAVLTISDEGGDEIWSSKDCPRGSGSVYVAVPAGGTATHTIEWDRRHSAPRCATPPVKAAGPGTYLAEATVPGVKGVLRSAITLAKD
ncbi:hypothetical protein LUX01_10430 [Streptomyces sudanensis]|uniref:hypothetical protein n=1 Tax=Streptomyces sudanensis TaxID=436397 RepID=UPI0020CE9C80|nr:hypothetical protein [Streptomyces sudanensis]MCP9987049.1 hypothetical protein [Streptomyces sudanensis]